jgi:abortive infection bacteriophage resistance protein
VHLKPPTTFEEQLAILESRGLAIPNRQKALVCLAHANYFRLSCYHPPLLVLGTENFKAGSSFEHLWEMYRFDHQLRMLLLDAIERCEISFRTRWAYELAHLHGPQAYEKESLHKDLVRHRETLVKTDEEIRRSHERFMLPYQGRGAVRPPIWVVCEVMSLGQLSSLYANIANPSDRQMIAETYVVDEIVLGSFLHHLTVVRNLCAHHRRG